MKTPPPANPVSLCFLFGLPVERQVKDEGSEARSHQYHRRVIDAQAEPNGYARDSPCDPAIQPSNE